jgi:fructose-specific component phosphotransferase system IIB-like protein
LSINNQYITIGASISPAAMNGLKRADIAQALSDPTNLLSQGLLASANYITAAICKGASGEQPTAVCTSPGVVAAKATL